MYDYYLTVKPCKTGVGLFTSIMIPAEVPILEVRGDIYSSDTLPKPVHPATLQIGRDSFIGATGAGVDHVNHSCNPNCSLHVVGNRAFLYSLHVMPADSELTFDYSTSSTDTLDQWKLDCKCGSFNCRKVISGYQYLSDELKTEYEKRGMVPMFLKEDMFR